jgi:hypothetical protein
LTWKREGFIMLVMSVITSQKLTSYFERFKGINITFTKEILQVTGMSTDQVYLKCGGDFWPCVVFSSSFEGARVVVNIKSGLIQKLQQANNTISLRFCFKSLDTGSPLSFFVAARAAGYTPYKGSTDVVMFNLEYTQRPPDDLIEILGRILDANINSSRRREERIPMAVDTLRKLKLLVKETVVFIQKVPRRCILRDLSFSGAKIVMMGVAKFLINRDCALRVDFDDPRESFLLQGIFTRDEAVEGRKELVALVLEFTEAAIPMGYKIRINDYLSVLRQDTRGEGEVEARPAEGSPAKDANPEPPASAEASAPVEAVPDKTPSADEAGSDLVQDAL